MDDEVYKKEFKIKELTDEEKEIELITSIIKVKKEIDVANLNFEFAQDDLIDYYTYQIKANKYKLNYLVKKAKELGLSLDMIDQIDIKYNKAM